MTTGHYTRNPAIVSYHSHPVEIGGLFDQIPKLEVQRVVACEGFLGGGLAKNLEKGLSDDEYDAWIKIVMESAEDQHVLCAADHLLVVVKKV
jgi:S-adenosylmethionine-dependent methyltransferase